MRYGMRAGLLQPASHVGDEVVHLNELYGMEVGLDFAFFKREEMASYLASFSFEIEAAIEREP